jgi:hypothetical protein
LRDATRFVQTAWAAFYRRQSEKKRTAAFVLAVPLNESKGITSATNSRVRIARNDPIVHAVSDRR